MTTRFLIFGALAIVLMLGGWLGTEPMGPTPPLRSEHSEPAQASPPAIVAVTPGGRLYHKPSCTLIHGPVRLEPGRQAIAEGYTPCTRCLPE
jgi:hypothetical protein